MKQVKIKCVFFYKNRKEIEFYKNPDGNIWTGTRKEALRIIEKLEQEPYNTMNNEVRKPKFSIIYDSQVSNEKMVIATTKAAYEALAAEKQRTGVCFYRLSEQLILEAFKH